MPMGQHTQPWELAQEAVEEYLAVARSCVASTKPDGGIYGYPATLLLFCVVNALGNYLRGDHVVIDGKAEEITKGEPFRVLNHPLFGLKLHREQIKQVELAYRNPLAHKAIDTARGRTYS